jgi:predicted nucleic acid-binding protein
MATRRTVSAPRRRVVLDSSCWLEHFAGTERADLFAPALAAPAALVVPVLTVYEVVKKLARELGDEVASQALALMRQGELVEIDLGLALAATRHSLPLADSLIYATALAHGAELWTQDAHFEGLPGVRYFEKRLA